MQGIDKTMTYLGPIYKINYIHLSPLNLCYILRIFDFFGGGFKTGFPLSSFEACSENSSCRLDWP